MTPARRPDAARSARVKASQSKGRALAESLQRHLLAQGVITVLEHRFHPTRRWRFDLAVMGPPVLVAVEIEGGVWVRGAHVRGAHFRQDIEKYAEAACLGWRVIRVSLQTTDFPC